MVNQDNTPIIVEVKNGRWDAYSINPEPTERDRMLLSTIQSIGGVNKSVSEGRWAFTITEVDGVQMLHLLPIDNSRRANSLRKSHGL